MYLAGELKKMVDKQPDAIVTSYNNRKKTYSEFYTQAERLAVYYQEKGYGKEDILAVVLPNSDFFLVCYYASQIGGFTILPINTKLAPREIEYILNHSEAKGIVYHLYFEETINEVMPKFPEIKDILTVGNENKSNRLEDIIVGPERKAENRPAENDDTAVLFYTSGTTGKPKGVMLTNQNILSIAQIWSESMEISNVDRIHIVAPLFHCAASHAFAIPTIYAGGSLIIEEGFSPVKTIQTMDEEKVTIFFGVPAMYNILLRTPSFKEVSLPNLRLLAYGAAPMPYELVKRLKKIFPDAKVENLYGQTENSPGATALKDHYALTKVGSVGEALPQCEVQVVNANGENLRQGEVGEIIVKGPHIMKGYLKNEIVTKETIKAGWLYTGDLGRFDEDGFLYIVDRMKDMIIRGGENIYPVEIEEILYEIPEILEAAIIGVPHEVLGEVAKAVVVKKKDMEIDEEQILEYCKKKLARYKVPHNVEFVEELPRNSSGKVLKTQLRSSVAR